MIPHKLNLSINQISKGRKLKTTTEALENGQDTGIELKVQAQTQQLQQQQQTTAVTLNPALHSAAGNIAATPPPVRGHTCVRGKSLSTNGSRRPPGNYFFFFFFIFLGGEGRGLRGRGGNYLKLFFKVDNH